MTISARVVEILLLICAVISVIIVLLEKLTHRRKKRPLAIFYRIIPYYDRFTRTEIIATVGLLVAILGLIVALLR